LNENLYEYLLETSLGGYISKETLVVNNNLIFKRTKTSYCYNQKKVKIAESLYPTLRRLSMDIYEDSYITEAFEFLSNFGYLDATNRTRALKATVEKDYRDLIVEKSPLIKEILSQYREFPLYSFLSKPTSDGKKEYFIQLDAGKETMILPYQYMSSGMLNQSVLLSTLLSLPSNGVLLIDEIEDALHPLTILDFIHVAQERNIQLIFSSHNTYLLQKLRPDQIIFANWKNGYSTYKKLSDIYPNIREVNNIEKMYFSNMFEEDIKNG
jgi:AAA15 family ATPase/GTPase